MSRRSDGAGGACWWSFGLFTAFAGLSGYFASGRMFGRAVFLGLMSLLAVAVFHLALNDYLDS